MKVEYKLAAINFLKFILRSLAMSLVVSVTAYCYLTRTFPPDLSRLKNIYSSYKKLTKLTTEIQASQILKSSPDAPVQSPDDEDKDLAQLIEHRRQIIDLLSQFNFTQPVAKKPSLASAGVGSQDIKVPDEVILSTQSYNNLRLQINELTQENNLLRQQIVEIQKQISSRQATQ